MLKDTLFDSIPEQAFADQSPSPAPSPLAASVSGKTKPLKKKDFDYSDDELRAFLELGDYTQVFRWAHKFVYPKVLKAVFSNHQKEANAQDAFMDGFEDFWQHWLDMEASWDGSLSHQLFVFCSRKWLGEVRKQRTATKHQPFLPLPNSSYNEGEKNVIKAEEYAALYALLDKLPLRDRAQVILFYKYDLSHEDIAIVLGFENGNNSKSTMDRVKAKLRQIIPAKFFKS